jgi:hypothetical protein
MNTITLMIATVIILIELILSFFETAVFLTPLNFETFVLLFYATRRQQKNLYKRRHLKVVTQSVLSLQI